MDWSMIISGLFGALAGGGLTSLANLRSGRKKAAAEADITASEEWHRLYDEQHARNSELEAKVDELSKQNIQLQLENQELRHKVERNTEDIDELRAEVRRLSGKKGAVASEVAGPC